MIREISKIFCEDCTFFISGITKVGVFCPKCFSEKATKPNWKSKNGINNPAILNKDNDCIYFMKNK